ncbi:hypothetical protein CSKR_200861 [Clonorchis sinensis]|uniref:Uncharacterized protein n=1 Tax=Clonorchis sinensis TaxID=79923 RepID=A0A8T1MJE9_CLOSI|nr:hypothetical protein CSKR_200861 [Clonorchis sinensis]
MDERTPKDFNNNIVILALCIASLLVVIVVLLIVVVTYYYFRKLSGKQDKPCISSCCLDSRTDQDPIVWPDSKRVDKAEPKLQLDDARLAGTHQFHFHRYKDEEPDHSAAYQFEDGPDESYLQETRIEDRGPIHFPPPMVPPYSEVNNPFFQPQIESELEAAESASDKE